MKDKVVLITGANGGLGNSVTETFLNAGAIVAGASRKIAQDEFKSPNFHAFPAELSNLVAARKLADEVAQKFGKIDALIHLVGAFAGGASVAETDDATWAKMLDLNLNTAFHTLRAVLPHMRKAGSGRVVAIGSRIAVEPQPGVGAYEVSKAALVSLIRATALENKDAGINVNIILPDTDGHRREPRCYAQSRFFQMGPHRGRCRTVTCACWPCGRSCHRSGHSYLRTQCINLLPNCLSRARKRADRRHYSLLRARIGSIAAARRAGT